MFKSRLLYQLARPVFSSRNGNNHLLVNRYNLLRGIMRDILVSSDDDGYRSDCQDSNGNVTYEIISNGNEVFHGEPRVFHSETEADFGVLFDVDGVLARGSTPLVAARQAIDHLKDDQGQLKVPVAFVTNACNRSHDKAAQIQKWLNIQVTPDMVIHAPTPARLLTEFHHKHVLIVGQEYRLEIAEDLGFTNVCTIEDVQKAFPLLDMVDHENREAVAKGHHPEDTSFPPVEAVLLIGEPTKWESHLQLLVDLILSGGLPTASHTPKSVKDAPLLPIIACNMDLVFMHQACMPRFGHGAFLVCLEALYKKITGKDLEYRALIGKPCEITYRYAEHVIGDVAKRLGIHRPIRKLYFVGDNPNVDVVGANLYDRYLKKVWSEMDSGNFNEDDICDSVDLPSCRAIPRRLSVCDQTVKSMESILVGTGVFKPKTETGENSNEDDVYHGHRDINYEPDLNKPSRFVTDVCHGIKHILKQENFTVKHKAIENEV